VNGPLSREATAQPGNHDLHLVAEGSPGTPATPESGAQDQRGTPRRPSQATRALEMCAGLALFRTPEGDPYCRIAIGGHLETWSLESTGFRRWLRAEFYRVEGQGLRDGAVGEVVGTLAGAALFGLGSTERPAPIRLAEHAGAIYLDLCTPGWEQVAITPAGWRLVPAAVSPVAFHRTPGLLPLPMPVVGGHLEGLRRFLNARDEDAWRLIVAWLVQALRPSGPYPVLVLTGQQGSAKTTTGRLLRALVDPHRVPLRRPPREERELAIAAGNAWVVALDNVSRLPDWLSDGLCCLATGGGFGARALYSDSEEALFSYTRPCLLTSIEDTVERSDLLDRALLVELAPIPPQARRAERALWLAFAHEHPALLGALLDVVAGALGRVEGLHLPASPRLADFALWVSAAEPALGWAKGTFLASYAAGRAEARVRALEASPLVAPLRQLLAACAGGVWEGTATELLAALEGQADDATRRRRDWPKGGNILSGALRRLGPNLDVAGLAYEAPARTKEARLHRLRLATARVEDGRTPSSPPSPASPGGSAPERIASVTGDGAGPANRHHAPEHRHPSSPRSSAVPDGQQAHSGDDVSERNRHLGQAHRHPPSPPCVHAPEGTAAHTMSGDGGDGGDDGLQPCSITPSPAAGHSERAPATQVTSAAAPAAPYTLVTDRAALMAALPTLGEAPVLALDTETTGLDPHTDRLRLLTLATSAHSWLIDTWRIPSWEELLRLVLAAPGRTLLGHNLGFDLRFLQARGLETHGPHLDTMLAAQLLEAGAAQDDGRPRLRYSLAAVAERYLGLRVDKDEQRSDWAQPDLTAAQLFYAAQDGAMLHPLHIRLSADLAAAGLGRAWAIEQGCLPSLAWLVQAGMPFDQQAWAALSDAALLEQQGLRRAIDTALSGTGANRFGGFTFSPDSPAQVAQVLRRLGIALPDGIGQAGTGTASVDEAALLAVRAAHPVVPLLLAYRDAAKRAGTYGIGWAAQHVNATTGRIHGDYRQLGAASGRLSCTRPNLQNIPRSREYRACFAPAAERALVKADYATIELRLAAVIAEDRAMLAAFAEGADLHRRTAAEVLGIPEQAVTREQRQLAKALNFGLIYGMGARTLVEHAATGYGVQMSEQEAEQHRVRFFRAYPGIRRWQQSLGCAAAETRTLAGRRRLSVPTFAQRANSPVQGSGADGLKAALGRLWRHRHEVPTARLVATVHDEVVAECPAAEAAAVADWLQRHMVAGMEEIVTGRVPIVVETTIARDWAGGPLPAAGGACSPACSST
jgi:DNA polymerase-1